MGHKRVLRMIATLIAVSVVGVFAAPDSSGAMYTKAEVDALLALKTDAGATTMIWMLLGGALVFFMQAGFAMVEVGLTRPKNAVNILMKNLMDFAVGSLFFLALGWGLMYGATQSGLFGSTQFFLMGIDPNAWNTTMQSWFFQVVFAATAATIVSGAVAERIKFSSYLIYTAFITALVYPISGHWIWGGGFLFEKGFHDFAGSTVVHVLGGSAALMGALILGPRIGKYVKVGDKVITKAIPGHNLPMAVLGVFILWFGWYGFNAASTLNGNDPMIAHVAVTTTLAAASGSLVAMILTWVLFKKPDVSMSMNGALAGLVSITAGCYTLNPLPAVFVGAIAGVLVVFSVELLDKYLHIDDPVGAFSVHGVNGFWGTLAVGLFAVPGRVDGVAGFFYTGSWATFSTQLFGVLVVMVWGMVTMGGVFLLLKKVNLLRVSEREERQGLDINEHGADAYHGFQIFSNM